MSRCPLRLAVGTGAACVRYDTGDTGIARDGVVVRVRHKRPMEQMEQQEQRQEQRIEAEPQSPDQPAELQQQPESSAPTNGSATTSTSHSTQEEAAAATTPVHNGIGAMRAVTISRLYGSGGGEIGARLAKRLDWQLVDHEIVAQVAQKMGITVQEADARDERAESFLSRMLSTMQLTSGALPNPTPLVVPLGELQAAYHQALCSTVEAAAEQGHVVIIGRGSQVVLANRRDVLHVRIIAPLEDRIAYVARREGVNETEAAARIKLKDKDRLYYLRAQYHQQADDPLLYDLIINTAVLDLDSAVEVIVAALEAKSHRLGVPESALGPAAGQPRYPGRPEDLRPPYTNGEAK